MATYKQIQEYTKRQYGFVPKTCWIADVKNEHGLTTRVAVNRKCTNKREYPCPSEKREAIEKSLKFFKMISN